MKKFQFSLENVLNYKNQVLEEIQNEYASAVQQVRQQERRLVELEERHRALNREFRQAEAEGITVAEAMGYESGLRVLERTIRQAEERLQQLRDEAEQVRQELLSLAVFDEVLIAPTHGISTLYASDGGIVAAI